MPSLRTTVPRTLLTALTIYSVGCIVPTPLEAERLNANHPPLIVKGTPSDFGILTVNKSDPNGWTVGVVASDEDEGDTLYARMTLKNGDLFQTLIDPIILTGSPREGRFPMNTYCPFLKDIPDPLVYVFVTDGKFASHTSQPGKPGFLAAKDAAGNPLSQFYDSNFWLVKGCQ
ncbi:MAG: hypothetical protein EXR72_25105 [Myxococcales bacterium]|nr:hypothetical protein [Myxococcales bacterium]